MRLHNLLVFDDIISGTSSTWYSRSDLQRAVGNAEAWAVQACVTNVSGFLPALTVLSEHSCDSLHWAATSATEINGVLIAEGGSYAGTSGWLLIPATFVRFKITLGGLSPECRLELTVTGRGHGQSATSGAIGAATPALAPAPPYLAPR